MASYCDAQSQTPRRFLDSPDTHGSKENMSPRRIQQVQRPNQSTKNSSASVSADVQIRLKSIENKVLYRDQKAQTPKRFNNDSDTLADVQNRLKSIENMLAIVLSRLPAPSDESNPPLSNSHNSNSQTYQNTSPSYNNHQISSFQQESSEGGFQAVNVASKNTPSQDILWSDPTSFESIRPLLTVREREQLHQGNKRLEGILHISG